MQNNIDKALEEAAKLKSTGTSAYKEADKKSKKTKRTYDRISLATTPDQKAELQKAMELAEESSLSRFIIKELKKLKLLK